MVTRAFSCDHGRLRQLLAGELDEADRNAVEQHLDECDSCCVALESFAGDDSWWKDASRLLTPIDGEETLEFRDRGNSVRLLQSSPLSDVDRMVGEMSLDFLEPSDSPAMLGRLGQYDIIEPLGSGGMGIVLKGYDQDLNRYVAIKVLAPHYATSSAARKRFAREGQASAAVVNPHVVAIHGVSTDGKLPYLVMPYVRGESLQQRIDVAGPLKLKEVLRIAMQAARGLHAAHEQGLVHRDIKPGNILLERGVDRVLLTDFGLARAVDDASMTRSGVIAGTPQYMSPEQARGDAVDHRSDLFSLGSCLYAMCAGRPPFRADNTMGLLNRIVEGTPRPICEVNPDVPDWLAAIIERLHLKSPADRFGSAGELADLLEQCLAHVQQPHAQPLPESLAAPKRDSKGSILSLIGGLAIATGLFYGFGMLPGDDSDSGTEGTTDSHRELPGETGHSPENQNGFDPPGEVPNEDEPQMTADGDSDLPTWSEVDGELNLIRSGLITLNRELERDLELSPPEEADERADEATRRDDNQRNSREDESEERDSAEGEGEERPTEDRENVETEIRDRAELQSQFTDK